jgi:hypothetical protein
MSSPTDLQRNVQYCLSYFHETRLGGKKLGAALGVAPSTIYRWMILERTPYKIHVSKLAQLVRIRLQLFEFPHDRFKDEINRLDPARLLFTDFLQIERRIVLGSVEKWKSHIDECFERHVGTYYMYCRLLSQPTGAAISLVRVLESTEHGIAFDLHNIDTRQSPRIDYYYRGLMFPIAECLAFYGEERSLNEPFSMITSAAQVPTKSILVGNFIAVAVHGPMRRPSGNKVALQFRSEKILNVEQCQSNLGVVRFEALPEDIQQLI